MAASSSYMYPMQAHEMMYAQAAPGYQPTEVEALMETPTEVRTSNDQLFTEPKA